MFVIHQLVYCLQFKHFNKMKFIILAVLVAGAYASVSSDEAALVQSTWAQVKGNEVDILAAIFAAYPDIQARFPAFVGKDLASVKGSAAFATHATRIVGFISQYVSLLGSDSNQAAIETVANQLGQSHVNRGVPKAQFNELRSALVSYLQANVSWGANVETAWNDALDQLYGIVFSKY